MEQTDEGNTLIAAYLQVILTRRSESIAHMQSSCFEVDRGCLGPSKVTNVSRIVQRLESLHF